jgi:formyltetrahydrofolate synthetase
MTALNPVLKPIEAIAERLGIPAAAVYRYGPYKAKIALDFLTRARQQAAARGRLILVTAISPTPAGEGKTTTTIGLGDALSRIGKKVAICLREPSLGPCLGSKGGATGGGKAQIAPADEINLHFTGDLHAIGVANNLLAALIDNHVFHGNALGIDIRQVTWRRVVDLNDRALRDIVVGLGGVKNGYQRYAGRARGGRAVGRQARGSGLRLQPLGRGRAGGGRAGAGGSRFGRAGATAGQLALSRRYEAGRKNACDRQGNLPGGGYFGSLPICVAKTQYSFSADPDKKGAPTGHIIPVREVRLSAGAGFVVVLCGDIVTMPGLTKNPAAVRISVDADGEIQGLR